MPNLANPRQEAFCQARAIGKSQDEAYAAAGYKPSVHHASRLARIGKVLTRIRELEAQNAQTYEITVELITKRLDEDRALAFKCNNPSAAVQATVALSKLGGLMTDKSSVVVTHNYALMSEDEIRFELAALAAEARSIKPGVQH